MSEVWQSVQDFYKKNNNYFVPWLLVIVLQRADSNKEWL